MSDTFLFFRTLASNPLMVGAIAPSGPALASLITSGIDPSDGPVLELGPGTGIFTEALLARGVRQTDLTLVESVSDFANVLRLRFPEARVLRMDAARLGVCRLFGNTPLGSAISGLPLLNMSPRKVSAVLTGVFSLLRKGGALYQFTYGVRCPVSRRLLDRLGLKASLHGRVLRNFPPARVYKLVRRKPLTLHEVGR